RLNCDMPTGPFRPRSSTAALDSLSVASTDTTRLEAIAGRSSTRPAITRRDARQVGYVLARGGGTTVARAAPCPWRGPGALAGPPTAARRPPPPSSAAVEDVPPACARSTARMPPSAANPTWNGLLIVPKFATTPPESDAAPPRE